MTREELEKELARVRESLVRVRVGSREYIAGKEIEKAILHSLGVKDD